MDKNFEKEVLRKFDTVIKLLTISSLKGEKQLEKIKILSGEGLPPKEIADLIGTSANTVSVALNKIKNKPKSLKEENNDKSKIDEGLAESEENKSPKNISNS